MRGKFIVIEGTDGSGTTTQSHALSKHLASLGIRSEVTAEPSSGPIGSLIRKALAGKASRKLHNGIEVTSGIDDTTLALMFAADRMDHVFTTIEPNLEIGNWIICDRYTLSSCIYQSLTAPVSLQWIQGINSLAPAPDMVIVLDVKPDVALERRNIRGGPKELFDGRELQAMICAAYSDAEAYTPSDFILHVDANRTQSEVARTICGIVADSSLMSR